MPRLPLAIVLIAAALLASIGLFVDRPWNSAKATHELVLLVPDDLDRNDAVLGNWIEALREEGYAHSVMSASEVIRASKAGTLGARGLILPDTIHKRAGAALLDVLKTEVQGGAALLLVYDAAIATPNGSQAPPHKLRALAGLDYALHDEMGEKAATRGPILASSDAIRALRLPPGRLMPVATLGDGRLYQATAYGYERADFPYLVTRQPSSGVPMLQSESGVLANLNSVGKGRVLFVNLPLGFLRQRTDGVWLHSFIRYFGDDLLASPRLLAAPDGVGGLIMNWHVDDRKALNYLTLLQEMGFGDFGPYSIHLTVGPDSDVVGDGQGMDLTNNPAMQRWVQAMSRRGNEIGSHGGWAHNVFSREVDENSRTRHEQMIRDNIRVVENVTGKRVTEYSAPSGNHPKWTMDLLSELGINAYYTTGNAGMGATRAGVTAAEGKTRAWSFPISVLGQAASFEEANDNHLKDTAVGEWLADLSTYCIENRAVRLFYFHPIGVSMFQDAAAGWMRRVRAAQARGELRMYTMADIASFMAQRDGIRIQRESGDKGSTPRWTLTSETTMQRQVFSLPKSRFGQPHVVQGTARIVEAPQHWLIHPGEGRMLQIKTEK